ncbi:MAG: addiction module protein [Acidobacteria bacterium]|nr:addiction module protein [Acidobacteriota bacterium]
MARRTITDLLELRVAERVPVTEEQGRELDRRLQAHRESPEAAAPWNDVRERLIARL